MQPMQGVGGLWGRAQTALGTGTAVLTVAAAMASWIWSAGAHMAEQRAVDERQDRAIQALHAAEAEQSRRYDTLLERLQEVAGDARETKGMVRALAGKGR